MGLKQRIKEIYNWIKSRNQNGVSNRWVTFLYCLLVALVFWLMIVFSNQYKAPITFKLRYTNFPKDKMLANNLPHQVDVDVLASGFTFLGYYFNRFNDTLVLNLASIRKNPNSKDYYLPLYEQSRQFEQQLGNQVKITQIQLDTLHFYFDKRVVKVIPVKLNLNYEFEKQFQLNGKIEVKPSKIVVSGPASIMEDLLYVNTQQLNLFHLNKSVARTADLIVPEELKSVEFSAKKVVVKVPVEKYTEGKIELPVEVLNLPEQFLVKTFPEQVKVTYLVSLSNYGRVRSDQFSLLAYYDENATSLKLKLMKYPEIVRNPRIETDKVEFILRKR